MVLVSSIERKKWTTVRTLPTKKSIPAQFEVGVICLFQAKKITLFFQYEQKCMLFILSMSLEYSCMPADL